MPLTAHDMKRLAELGATLEIVTVVTEILERHTAAAKRDGKPLTQAERAKRYREKRKLQAASGVTESKNPVTTLPVVSPTPPSLENKKTSLKLVKTEGFEESKGFDDARADEPSLLPDANGDVTEKRDVTKSPKTVRGTRLAEDWEPAEATLVGLFERGYTEDELRRELEKFKNHYLSRAGSKAVMVNWDRAFVNWMIRSREYANERRN